MDNKKQIFRITEDRVDYLMTLSGDELVAEICRMTDKVISHLNVVDAVILKQLDMRALADSEVEIRKQLGIEELPYGKR